MKYSTHLITKWQFYSYITLCILRLECKRIHNTNDIFIDGRICLWKSIASYMGLLLLMCNIGICFIFMVNNSLNRNKCHHHTVHGLSRNEIWPTSLLSSPMSRFNLHQMIRKIYYPIVIVWLWVSVIWRRIYIYSFHYLFLWVSFHRWKLYCAFHSNMILRSSDKIPDFIFWTFRLEIRRGLSLLIWK